MVPKQITPNPLLKSTVELRFKGTLPEEYVNQYIADSLCSKLGLDKQTKNLNDKSGDSTPILLLQNEDYLIAVSTKELIFENRDTYHLWPNYYSFIREALNVLQNIEAKIELDRVGLRYLSFFESVDGQQQTALKKPFLMIDGELGKIEDVVRYGSISFKKNGYRVLLRTGNRLKHPGETQVREGCIIDIDVASTESLPSFMDDQLGPLIDNLHSLEKELFISLLNDDFKETLNIKY